jgi:hypothetical protein
MKWPADSRFVTASNQTELYDCVAKSTVVMAAVIPFEKQPNNSKQGQWEDDAQFVLIINFLTRPIMRLIK